MRDDTPVVYLLAGPAGPAKAAYARALIDHGVVEVQAGSETASALVTHVRTGQDAFLDHETVLASDRDQVKSLVEEHGGQWCQITFSIDHSPLASQLGRSEDAASE